MTGSTWHRSAARGGTSHVNRQRAQNLVKYGRVVSFSFAFIPLRLIRLLENYMTHTCMWEPLLHSTVHHFSFRYLFVFLLKELSRVDWGVVPLLDQNSLLSTKTELKCCTRTINGTRQHYRWSSAVLSWANLSICRGIHIDSATGSL